LSFFDETDEPAPVRRARRPAGTGRRPPGDQQVIMIRRAVAGVAILVVIIVLALGVHSCQVSSRNSALKSYNTSVGSLIQQSDATGKKVFDDLSGAKSASNVQTVQTDLFNLKSDAQSQLQQAQNLGAPGEVANAQQNLVLTLSLRRTGISDIANRFQPALSKTTARSAINAIATDMQQFLASDVVYTTQTAPQIAAALHAAGIPVGGVNGETIQPTNYVPDLGWLTPTYIAGKLGSTVSSPSASGPNPCPTTNCGHQLNSVSVGGVSLSTGGGNTIPANPAPTFTANLTNNGTSTETHVIITASVTTASGETINAQTVEAATQAGQSYDAQIALPKAPPTGTAQVTVTVKGVPGETYLANNTLTFPVTFD
jgi:hypothetical protein